MVSADKFSPGTIPQNSVAFAKLVVFCNKRVERSNLKHILELDTPVSWSGLTFGAPAAVLAGTQR
jgi:hypothetical protein